MGYLNLTDESGFTQAIISLWFRVPQFSLDAATAAIKGDGSPFDGIIPIVVFGQPGLGNTPTQQIRTDHVLSAIGPSGIQYHGNLVNIDIECTSTNPLGNCCITSLITYTYECDGSIFTPDYEYQGTTYQTIAIGPQPPTPPSFIGVTSNGNLYVNFESNQKPTVENYACELSSITPAVGPTGVIDGQCISGKKAFGCNVLDCFSLINECSNSVDNGHGYDDTTMSPPPNPGTGGSDRVDHFTDIPYALDGTSSIYSDTIPITPGAWHHLLVSVDLKTMASHGIGFSDTFMPPISQYIDAASQLYIALDDKNHNQGDLGNWVQGAGDNDVVSDGAFSVAGTNACQPDGADPTYSLESSAVPAGPVGIPATATYVQNIFDVDTAELQFWTGRMLDTTPTANRRLFVTDKGAPASVSVASKQLGRPDILIHGTGSWISGRNTGTLGQDDNGKIINSGQFTPTGTIIFFKPDPKLSNPPGQAVKPTNPKSLG